MTVKWLIPYPEEHTLEDAAYARGERSTRIYHLLLPVWGVEIRATVTEAEPYDLIDYYLERGIRACALDTTAELADLFSLDEVLVDRALRVLARIGHVGDDEGWVALTEIGLRSVQDRWRYTVRVLDRRELYFDGICSQPLPRVSPRPESRRRLRSSSACASGTSPSRSLRRRWARCPRGAWSQSRTHIYRTDPSAVAKLPDLA
ncbi:hypothetical protein OHR68_06980 [Spirillospora sp. NBC_00431]